jgi:predicted MFS family arabinose efflux permease
VQRIEQSEGGMSREEFRAALSLSSVYALRMLGLFMILPVFALYAGDLEGVTPTLTGLAIGIYGLTQAALQIPAGLLSDRIGRKPVIIGGLLIFALGSVVAALADSMLVVILGRALQGAGAIAAAIMALAADLTREQHRIKAMALIGMSIGLSFALALVLGPVLNDWVGVPGIFAITAVLAVGGILVVGFVVPRPVVSRPHRVAEAIPEQFGRVLRQTQLLRLDFGILMLHAILTASFVVLPLILRDQAGVAASAHWKIYLPVLVCSVLAMLPLIIMAERKGRVRPVFLSAIALLIAAELGLFFLPVTLYSVVFMMFVFFTAFNLLEAMLPSLISRIAPADCRGTAMGFYSSSQFFGAFLGGALGGVLHQYAGTHAVFLCSAIGAALWLLLALSMSRPEKLSSYIYKIDGAEGVAYLKVDKRVFDEASLP